MPRVLITGAAGFIGMHTSIRFLKEGWDVVGLDNLNNYYSVQLKEDRVLKIVAIASAEKKSFQLYRNDLNSEVWNELENLQIDALIHLAAQAGVRYSIDNPNSYLESNIFGFQRVLDFVRLKNIRPFIYASSSSVYGKDSEQPFKENDTCNSPESYYAATKKANELMATAYFNTHKVSSTGLRFFTVYGPWGRPDMAPMLFATAAFEGSPIKVFNHGNQKRDFTFIEDIVQAVFKIITKQNSSIGAQIYNVGFGSPVQLMKFIETIEYHTERILKKEFQPAQIGDVETTYADITKLRQSISYSPETNINEGIECFISWYKQYYKVN